MTGGIGRIPALAVAGFSLILTGCASWSLWPAGEEAPSQLVSGLVERGGDDRWVLRPCGRGHERLLQPTPQLRELFDEVAQPGRDPCLPGWGGPGTEGAGAARRTRGRRPPGGVRRAHV